MFWVHGFEAIKKVSGDPADTIDGVKTGYKTTDTGDSVTQDEPIVKEKTENSQENSNTHSQKKKSSDRILMGSLFSGGGTLEAGLTYQMLDKQFGVEYDGKIASVYADNHGDHIQVGRVEDFDVSKYEDNYSFFISEATSFFIIHSKSA